MDEPVSLVGGQDGIVAGSGMPINTPSSADANVQNINADTSEKRTVNLNIKTFLKTSLMDSIQ
jgi:hypothetical protein